ncbi:MAG TPA: stage V sporulation protein AC [Ruminococcus sp.]|nr:stage V sporulation protein AC [Ruminococcus sp.]
MNITPEVYQQMQERSAPKSNSKINVLVAFLTGGGICVIGQMLLELYEMMGFDEGTASAWVSVTLVLVSMFLTGFGLYEKMARHAGAGTLVPITGFANAVTSCAMEAKTEGYILGIGTKIFTIAGPVILYGCTASAIYGIIYYVFHQMM